MLYLFGDFALDTERCELRRGTGPIAIAPQVFDLLKHLIENRERVISKDDLITHVWGGRIVSESALTTRINAARSVIGDSGEEQRLIKTLPRKGIRFVAEVREQQGSAPAPDSVAIAVAPEPLSGLDRPSIAVLPFQNLSGDPQQDYFADGVVEDIITGLSRIKWLCVIARNSTFVYKNRAVDMKQVGRELGVGYAIDGSVRRSADRVRITIQLIETTTGAHILGERYESQLKDIFELQDEIAMSVIGAIEPGLRRAEIERVKRRRPSNLNAYDSLLQSLAHVTGMPKDADVAIPLLEQALVLEPDYGAAHALLSRCLYARFARGGLHEDDRQLAIRHAHAAVLHGGDDAMALAPAALVIAFAEHDGLGALELFDRALELSNSNVFALTWSAIALAWMGQSDRAIERATKAIRLSPFDTLNFGPHFATAISNFYTHKYDDAVEACRREIKANPRFSLPHAVLAAAFWRLGRTTDAAAAAKSVLACEPSFTIQGTAVAAELEPAVFQPLAAAWREIGLPN